MTQKQIEIILMRQLASYLALPIFIVDPDGNLIFFNEPAEALLGRTFDEAGEMPMSEWSTIFEQRDVHGNPMSPDDLPLVQALKTRRPSYRSLRITGLDGVSRRLDVTAYPLEGQGGRLLGAVALFWMLDHE